MGVAILLLVELAAFTLWKRWHWFFPSREVSEVYTKYAGTEGLNVAFFKDFRINDTISVDVTVLEALDSNGWNMLCKDFFIPKLDPFVQSLIDSGNDLTFTKRCNMYDYSQPVSDTSSLAVLRAVSYLKQTVSVFHIKNEAESHAVYLYNFDKSIKQTKTQL